MLRSNKCDLRRLMRARNKDMSTEMRIVASRQIVRQVEELDEFVRANTVLLFWPLPDEVDVSSLALKWYGDKRILLPVVVGDELELRQFLGQESLIEGAFGILEPVGEPFTDYQSVDLVIVPGLAFDSRGGRLGRGKGYYDRLLPRLKAVRVGVCFEHQICDRLECESHDVPMDRVICNRGPIK